MIKMKNENEKEQLERGYFCKEIKLRGTGDWRGSTQLQ